MNSVPVDVIQSCIVPHLRREEVVALRLCSKHVNKALVVVFRKACKMTQFTLGFETRMDFDGETVENLWKSFPTVIKYDVVTKMWKRLFRFSKAKLYRDRYYDSIPGIDLDGSILIPEPIHMFGYGGNERYPASRTHEELNAGIDTLTRILRVDKKDILKWDGSRNKKDYYPVEKRKCIEVDVLLDALDEYCELQVKGWMNLDEPVKCKEPKRPKKKRRVK